MMGSDCIWSSIWSAIWLLTQLGSEVSLRKACTLQQVCPSAMYRLWTRYKVFLCFTYLVWSIPWLWYLSWREKVARRRQTWEKSELVHWKNLKGPNEFKTLTTQTRRLSKLIEANSTWWYSLDGINLILSKPPCACFSANISLHLVRNHFYYCQIAKIYEFFNLAIIEGIIEGIGLAMMPSEHCSPMKNN